ncbi:hypothetical protein J6590_035948 [Homalodisca vitripennis]|nr:hypothetical protein J6590_035948 [Homalodisca vitripennis]
MKTGLGSVRSPVSHSPIVNSSPWLGAACSPIVGPVALTSQKTTNIKETIYCRRALFAYITDGNILPPGTFQTRSMAAIYCRLARKGL